MAMDEEGGPCFANLQTSSSAGRLSLLWSYATGSRPWSLSWEQTTSHPAPENHTPPSFLATAPHSPSSTSSTHLPSQWKSAARAGPVPRTSKTFPLARHRTSADKSLSAKRSVACRRATRSHPELHPSWPPAPSLGREKTETKPSQSTHAITKPLG